MRAPGRPRTLLAALLFLALTLAAVVAQALHDSFHATDYAEWGGLYPPNDVTRWWRGVWYPAFGAVDQLSGFVGHSVVELMAIVALTANLLHWVREVRRQRRWRRSRAFWDGYLWPPG